MKNYTDDSILKPFHLKLGRTVITAPNGYTDLHEGSNIYNHNGQLIWMGTCMKDGKFSLHYWVCSNPNIDLEDWDYRGKITIKDGDGRELEAEDPYFYFDNGMWWIFFENKTEEKEHGLFKISTASYASELSDTFYFLGGAYGMAQFGDFFAKLAIYSGCLPKHSLSVLFFDGRGDEFQEDVGIAYWSGKIFTPDPKPIFKTSQIPNALTTGIGDDIHLIKDRIFVMEIVAFIKHEGWDKTPEGRKKGHWCQGLATSNSLRSGWELLDSDIKTQDGKHALFNLFYSNGWKALATTIDQEGKLYLAEVVVETTEPEPDPDPEPINDNERLKREIMTLAETIINKAYEIK